MRNGGAPLRVLAIEPYGARSHRQFLEGLGRYSRHSVTSEIMPARKWKWRMRTSAIYYSRYLEKRPDWDLLFVSDFLNLAEFVALLPARLQRIPAVVYFHENQLTYPLQDFETRDYHFALTHVYSILAARRALFNSHHHRRAFLAALPDVLDLVPDIDLSGIPEQIAEKSSVLGLGIDAPAGVPRGVAPGETPIVLWNHRWEYDKNPRALVDGLLALRDTDVSFRLRVLGERFRTAPSEFEQLKACLGEFVEDCGFLRDREDYWDAVKGAHVVLSTAIHEFFGLSVLEGLRAGLYPVLPDDLAYPELIPPELRRSGLFLYPRGEGLAPLLGRALRTIRDGRHLNERRRVVEFTSNFSWSQLARKYDDVFENTVVD